MEGRAAWESPISPNAAAMAVSPATLAEPPDSGIHLCSAVSVPQRAANLQAD